MRTLGSEAGRSEERAARRPTSRRKSLERLLRVASTARPRVCAQRAWYGFCGAAKTCFNSKVWVVARTDANRYRSLRALCKPPYRSSFFLGFLHSPSPSVYCLLNKFTYNGGRSRLPLSAHHPHFLVKVPVAPQPAFFAARPHRPSNLGEIEAHRRPKFLRSGLHKACPTWQLLL